MDKVDFPNAKWNPFKPLAGKAGGIKANASQVERENKPLVEQLVKAGIVKPTSRLYGGTGRFSAAYTSGFQSGVIRGIQEKIDDAHAMQANRNISATQQKMSQSAPGSSSSWLDIKTKPKTQEQKVEKNPMSNPPSSKTAKGIDILGGKGGRRTQKQNRNVNAEKPKQEGKRIRTKMKQRGGPKK